MIYIRNNSNDPFYNLAFEEYFFKSETIDDAILLLWQNGPSVIIGRYQNTIEEINEDFIDKNNINVVRRNTGGGAVYHDYGNLNYSFIVPSEEKKIDFETFTKPVIDALKEMGIEASLAGRNDLVVEGKKFSGNAQYTYNGRLLHHGTLLFDADLSTLDKALKMKKGKIESKSIKSVRSKVTNLKPYFNEDVDVNQFKEKLLEHFYKAENLKEYKVTAEDRKNIETLADEKYRTWKWTYGESPKCNVIRGSRFNSGYIEFRLQIEKGLIVDAYIYGDFFSGKSAYELLDKFKGIEYKREAIEKALKNVDLRAYLGDVSLEELINTIC